MRATPLFGSADDNGPQNATVLEWAVPAEAPTQCERPVETLVAGLLPATRYELRVTARPVVAAALARGSGEMPGLRAEVEAGRDLPQALPGSSSIPSQPHAA